MADTNMTPGAASLSLNTNIPLFYNQQHAYINPLVQTGNGYRTAPVNAEQLVHIGRCRVLGIYPEAQSTGTITLRDAVIAGSAIRHQCAAALLVAGKSFGIEGLEFANGLTVQNSLEADRVLITWKAL